MVKTETKPDPKPEPTLGKITITFNCTIPLQQYGNIELGATQEILTFENSDAERSALTMRGLDRLRHDIALTILPLVEAEVMRGAPALLEPSTLNPDVWMQKNNSVYRWMRATAPEIEIPAMQTILAKKNSALE